MSQFGIGDVSVVIDILRNHLYKNKIQTMVQEYICNARDAHREAGQTNPISVNMGVNEFIVQDFGPGISPERMENVFIKYGNSTKRDGVQTGGFGIGAKSAWAYTSSFDIITVTKEDTKLMRRHYRASVTDNKQGELTLLSEQYIPNGETGTTIKIKVNTSDMEKFDHAVQRAVYFWKESERPRSNTNLVFFEPALTIGEMQITHAVDPGFQDCIENSYDKATFVIDGVPYGIPQSLKYNKIDVILHRISGRAAINLDPKHVEISASREALTDSDKTSKYVTDLSNKLQKDITNYVTKKLAVNTIHEFAEAAAEVKEYISIPQGTKFKEFSLYGDVLNNQNFMNLEMTQCQSYTPGRRRRSYGQRSSSEGETKITHLKIDNLALNQVNSIFYQDSLTETKMIQNRRIKEYIEDNGGTVILLERKPSDDVRQAVHNVTTFDKMVVELKATPLSTLPVSPIVRTRRPKEDIPIDNTVTIHQILGERKSPITKDVRNLTGEAFIYVKYDEYIEKQERASQLVSFIDDFNLAGEFQVVALTDKALNKLLNNNIQVIEMDDWLNTYQFDSKTIDRVKGKVANNLRVMHYLEEASPMINDNFVVSMFKEYTGLGNFGNEIPALIINTIQERYLQNFMSDDAKLQELFNVKYPLAKAIAFSHSHVSLRDEVINYMNTKI